MYKSYNEIDLSWFIGREKGLSNVWRYNNFSDFYYRSNIFQHSIRLFYFISYFENEIKEVYTDIDFVKVQLMSLVHDDVEVIIGDFASANRLNMSKKDILDLDSAELLAIEEISNKFPEEINWYSYKDLLKEIFYKNTIESQLVKLFDHLDWFWESLHEYYAWNKCVTINPENEYWKIVLAFDYYIDRFKTPLKYYSLLGELFKVNNVPFNLDFPRIDFENQVTNYNYHTQESLNIDTWYELYDLWKKVILSNNDLNEIFSLLEFSDWRFYDRETNIFTK